MAELTKIGKYEVLDVLGRGAFGVVYRCCDPGLDRIVAVKVLLAAEHASPELLDRFENEARTAAKLSHPHIVQVYDSGLEAGKPFLVMEFVEGQTLDALRDVLGSELLPLLQLMYHLADALAYSHERGIVHRDVKPSNIIVDSRGRPKLMDFGLARLADESRWLSASGDLIGTPRYMSPEQALLPSEEVDVRTDIYSLGAIFYELLTKQPLVDGPTPLAVLKQLTDGRPVPLSHWRPDLPPNCLEVCNRMIAQVRDQRFGNAQEVAEALKRLILEFVIAAPEISSLAIDPVSASDFALKEQPSAILPAVSTLKTPVSIPWRGWIMGCVGVCAVLGLGWYISVQSWFGASADDVEQLTGNAALDPSLTLKEWQLKYNALAATRDDRQYHGQWNELREELNLAVRRNPTHRELRVLRGKVFLRNGNFKSAVEDWDDAGLDSKDPSMARFRLHTLAMWKKLYLGSIAEGALTPTRYDNLIPWIETCESMEGDSIEAARSRTIAKWIRLAIGEEEFDPHQESSLPLVPREDPAFADLQTWRALVFLQYADDLNYQDESLPEDERRAARQERDRWDQRGIQVLREGLEYDAHHLGLLFLRTYRWSKRLEWDTTDGIAWVDAEKRHKPAFETAFLRYRVAPASLGFESAMGRAILLNHYGDQARALDQVSEFIDRGNLPVETIAFWAWLQINHPSTDLVDAATASSLLKLTDSAVEDGADVFGVYLIRGICHSALGKVIEAKRDLTEGKRACRINDWEEVSGSFSDWLQASDESLLVFQDRTVDTVWRFAFPESVRSKIQLDLIQDLTTKAEPIDSTLTEEERRTLLAAGYFRLAKMAAERDDREGVLKYSEACLEIGDRQLDIQVFEQDEMLNAWKEDSEFRTLLDRFRRKDP